MEIEVEMPTPQGFSRITAGTFLMGSPEDEPGRRTNETQHEVTLKRDFFLQRTTVTWAQWTKVRNWAIENGYTDLPNGSKGSLGDARNNDQNPVTTVSWYDAVKWLNAWSEREGLDVVYRVDGNVYRTGERAPEIDLTANGYRLPKEAEWEYAARAGTKTAFYTGEITHPDFDDPRDPALDEAGWYADNSDTGQGQQIHPVGQKQPNAWGLYDMHGNVWEFCSDKYDQHQTFRVIRGGSWYNNAGYCRAAIRIRYKPDIRTNGNGFRPARSSVE